MKSLKKMSSLILVAIIATCAFSFTSCKNIEEESSNIPNKSTTSSNSSDDNAEIDDANQIINPLTGKGMKSDKILNKRPMAVMINNIKISLPQRGISKADIMYELPVEGGITRMMAIFSDYTKLPEIGSIRSSRHDFLELVLPLDAIYVHFGGSKYAYSDIKKYNMDTIDGMAISNRAFFQDTSRLYKGREHTWFTDYERVKAGIDFNKTRTRQKDEKKQANMFNFASKDEPIFKATKTAIKGQVYFSNSSITTLDYNKKTKTYIKGIYGSDQMDEKANKPLEFTNAFILFSKVKTISSYGHKDIDLTSGTGYYVTHGKYHSIKWSKKDVNSPIEFTNTDDTKLIVNPGRSYLAFVPSEFKENTKFS